MPKDANQSEARLRFDEVLVALFDEAVTCGVFRVVEATPKKKGKKAAMVVTAIDGAEFTIHVSQHRSEDRLRWTSQERFWDKVNKDGPVANPDLGPCWVWEAGLFNNGYGQFRKERGPKVGAHVMSWEWAFGPIPQGLHVCHACDVRPCVRPSHLWLGTSAENIADRDRKRRGVHQSGEKNPSAKLTRLQVEAIRRRWLTGSVQQKVLSAEYGVSASAISAIVHGKIWKDEVAS